MWLIVTVPSEYKPETIYTNYDYAEEEINFKTTILSTYSQIISDKIKSTSIIKDETKSSLIETEIKSTEISKDKIKSSLIEIDKIGPTSINSNYYTNTFPSLFL